MNGNPYYSPYWLDTDFLEHHGILGMRWGIRRYQPYPKGKHGTFLGQSRDNDIRIKKGESAYHVQKGTKLKDGAIQISFKELDQLTGKFADAYTSTEKFTYEFKDGKSQNSVKLQLTEDLIAPSYQKTMDTFIDTMRQVRLSDVFGEMPDKPEKARQPRSTPSKDVDWENEEKWYKYDIAQRERDRFMKNIKKHKVEECRDAAYSRFADTLMNDTNARKIFFDTLKQQGYNAIIDDRRTRVGKGYKDSSVILFDSSNVKVSNVSSISTEDAQYLARLFDGAITIEDTPSKFRKRWDDGSLPRLH